VIFSKLCTGPERSAASNPSTGSRSPISVTALPLTSGHHRLVTVRSNASVECTGAPAPLLVSYASHAQRR
jgi:hypothetical protein